MKMEPGRSGDTPRHAFGRCLLLTVVLGASGCRFLADELTVLDRRAPGAVAVPDAPVSGLTERP